MITIFIGTDIHGAISLRVATSSIVPDAGSLVREEQCQVLHWHLVVTRKITSLCLRQERSIHVNLEHVLGKAYVVTGAHFCS